jgi:pimeloyl-ACP methyl ester carboxylesterase
MAEILSKKMVKSQLAKVNNSAHFPQLENPEDCNSRIQGFLSKQTG